jgi:O-antigen/teichoic acid export membrane protein
MGRVESETAPGSGDEAADATRGSAIKLLAEILSRLLTLATTVLIARGLGGLSGFGAFGKLWALAPLVAELAELGLHATASRALVAGTLSWRSLVRARLVLLAGLGILALATLPAQPALEARGPSWLDVRVLVVLVLYFALAGWGEFIGVALRCRRARVQEAVLLFVLRLGGLVLTALVLWAGAALAGIAWALALSPLPALVLGTWLLREHPATVPAPDAAVGRVLREAAPLALYAGLLLLTPRVELLVLSFVREGREVGLFLTALTLFWPLSLVPSAVAAGAMPALTREALAGRGPVRRRTAATLALLAVPAAVGLALVSPALVPLVFGDVFAPAALSLRILAAALVPMFLNALVAWALIAAGRATVPARLMAVRVASAFLLAAFLVPRFGAVGAAIGLVAAELLLLLLGARAVAAGGFAVPVARPIALALVASVPMTLVVWGVRDSLLGAVALGVLTYAATLAAAWALAPGPARELVGTWPGAGDLGLGGRREQP